jgi:hypothetical protein
MTFFDLQLAGTGLISAQLFVIILMLSGVKLKSIGMFGLYVVLFFIVLAFIGHVMGY